MNKPEDYDVLVLRGLLADSLLDKWILVFAFVGAAIHLYLNAAWWFLPVAAYAAYRYAREARELHRQLRDLDRSRRTF